MGEWGDKAQLGDASPPKSRYGRRSVTAAGSDQDGLWETRGRTEKLQRGKGTETCSGKRFKGLNLGAQIPASRTAGSVILENLLDLFCALVS